MTDRTLPQLARSIERWRASDPAAMAEQSKAAVYFALQDARHDILVLADTLRSSATDQSVDANKMGGADCAGGGKEG